jgi:taurine transport system permease protein
VSHATRAKRTVVSTTAVVCVFIAWYLATDVLKIANPVMLPSPGEVFVTFLRLLIHRFQGATLVGHALASLKIVLISWALAVTVGVPLGVLMGWWRPLEYTINPIFQLLRPIPPIAWIPLSIVWFGIEDPARIFVVTVASFPPCVLNAFTAVRSVDPLQVRAARNLGARDPLILRSVVLPIALPLLVTGAGISLGNAWMTMVAAELLAARSGLGYVMQIARRSLQPDIIIVAMAVSGALGAGLSLALRRLAFVMTPWQRGPA